MKKDLQLTFVNVGYGEAIVLCCPDPARPGGQFVMVMDGGSGEAEEYAPRQSGRIPLARWLAGEGMDHIDVLAITHIHEDHVCGLPQVLQRWQPAVLWQNLPAGLYRSQPVLASFAGISPSQDKFRRALNDYRDIVRRMEGHIETVRAGWSCSPCPGLTVRSLGPSPERMALLEEEWQALMASAGTADYSRCLSLLDSRMNNYSMVTMLEYGSLRILLPGDTNREGYGDIPPQALRADLFKIGHHGQQDGADKTLLQAVCPRAVVCCASSDRRYNSAHPDTLALVREQGSAVYFSDCPLADIPPHSALTFRLREGEPVQGSYEPLTEAG